MQLVRINWIWNNLNYPSPIQRCLIYKSYLQEILHDDVNKPSEHVENRHVVPQQISAKL